MIGQIGSIKEMTAKNGKRFTFEFCTEGDRTIFYNLNGSSKVESVEGCENCPFYKRR